MFFPVLTLTWLVAISLLMGYSMAKRRGRSQSEEPASPPGPQRWRAVVQNAQRFKADSYSYGFNNVEDLRGEVAVRIVRGKEFLTIGTIETGADDFDELLHAMVAKAEDRAATLNAVLEMVAA